MRDVVQDEEFKDRHRTDPRHFSRTRTLTFEVVLMFILQKGVRALQLALNEVLLKLNLPLVSKSAYSQARQNLSHTAFIELNQVGVIGPMYGEDDYKRQWGYRVLAIDGSTVILPDHPTVVEEFGTSKWSTGENKPQGTYNSARASVLYDVYNRVAVDSLLAPGNSYEVDLAEQHLSHTQDGDLLVCDRNYASYAFLGTLVQAGREFVIRCQSNSFKAVRTMMTGAGPDSQHVTLYRPTSGRAQCWAAKLPQQIQVRLVRLVLNDGSYEVLVTSLLDEDRYPTAEFGPLYNQRWAIETFYGRLKNRLNLENFSGYTAAAVKQDFFAAVFLTGLEALLTDDAEALITEKTAQRQHHYQVNHAVSFHAIKHHVFELLYDDTLDLDTLCERLTHLFMTDPTCIRPQREVPRRNAQSRRLYNFHRRKRKVSF